MHSELLPVAWLIASAGEYRFDGPMNEQIRIAADRRGEMRIRFVCEPEMSDILGTVNRLAQRAQHYGLQQLHIRPRLYLFQQASIVLGMGFLPAGQLKAKLAQKLAQRGQLLRRGPLVYAIQRHMIVLRQIIRRADIRGEHAFLDQAMRIIALCRDNALDFSLVVEKHLGFDRLEIDGAAQCARFDQSLIKGMQRLQMRKQRSKFARGLPLWLIDRLSNYGIRQPCLRVHDRGIEAVNRDLAARGNI